MKKNLFFTQECNDAKFCQRFTSGCQSLLSGNCWMTYIAALDTMDGLFCDYLTMIVLNRVNNMGW